MLRTAYSALFTLALPLILIRLWWRGRQEPGYRSHIGERFGHFRQPPMAGAIWVHAVSVGEVRAAFPLLKALHGKYPGAPLLLTCMTPSGRAMARSLFEHEFAVTIAYLPYDLSSLHGRLLQRFKPRILLIMETEIWFNLIHACSRRKIPVLLVNGRLSERSRAGYARLAPIRRLAARALGEMSQVAAQSAADAFRFESLGARKVAVTGNLKFDMPVNPELLRRGLGWRKLLAGDRLVLLLAATREQEEDQLLAAFAAHFDAISRQQILLVVVPRHPQRFDGVFSLLATAGMKTARRSSRSDPAAGCEAWLGDSMGEMAAYYAMCDIAIIGGSFAPLGGQNLIEAAAVGKPTIIGPHVFNFSDAVDQAKAAGALLQVGDAAAAMDTAKTLLGDIERRAAMSAAALRFTSEHRGATDKTMRLISTLSDPAA